jgi:hypothetical protein
VILAVLLILRRQDDGAKAEGKNNQHSRECGSLVHGVNAFPGQMPAHRFMSWVSK